MPRWRTFYHVCREPLVVRDYEASPAGGYAAPCEAFAPVQETERPPGLYMSAHIGGYPFSQYWGCSPHDAESDADSSSEEEEEGLIDFTAALFGLGDATMDPEEVEDTETNEAKEPDVLPSRASLSILPSSIVSACPPTGSPKTSRRRPRTVCYR